MHDRTRRRPIGAPLLATAAVLLLASACQTAPKPMTPIENTAQITATVERIDAARRLLSLRSPSGQLVTVRVDPAIGDLGQMQVGDRVVARYREAIGARIRSTPATGEPASVALRADVAEPGERPAASASSTTTIPVTITAVDLEHHLVSFHGEDGLVRAITVQTPEGREFIRQLRPGDHVEATYTEAFAISVEPAP